MVSPDLLRDVEEAEAHLVAGALAPIEIAGREAVGLVGGAVVPVAFDGEAVGALDDFRSLEGVAALPVEVPVLDVQEAFARAARALAGPARAGAAAGLGARGAGAREAA